MRKSVFHEDWWLDALAPGSWREVTCSRGGRVVGSLRFVTRTEGGMSICEMPQITRFLGPTVTLQSGKTEARMRLAHAVITDLLKQVADFDHVEMTLDTGFSDVAAFLACGYEVRAHPTFMLKCTSPRDELWSGLRDKTKNVIRRARERLAIREVTSAKYFVKYYQANLEGAKSYFDLSRLEAVYAAASERQQCKILAAVDSNNNVHAQVFFVWDHKFVHYFLSSRDRSIAHPGSVSLLLWSGIELAHERGLHFDFDGGIENEARYKFVVAFGGELANRFDVSRSTIRYRLYRQLRRVPQALLRRLSAGAAASDVNDHGVRLNHFPSS
ncbi:GNAT family N-acetyltransferase [Bradyrhizobium elkanii]|uniref:GNAT family N-acetyltransferase n=1 Tax=Bradyrhizobium elkanii TaxID=29448 RepID=UPI001F0A27D6|nr:GNAT family N-acetyltransferase [Bradyrhizobium elkanii]